MSECKCTVCERPLSGGLDTYGLIQFPLCWGCWRDHGDEVERQARSGIASMDIDVNRQWVTLVIEDEADNG
jgi:hypothetical protein